LYITVKEDFAAHPVYDISSNNCEQTANRILQSIFGLDDEEAARSLPWTTIEKYKYGVGFLGAASNAVDLAAHAASSWIGKRVDWIGKSLEWIGKRVEWLRSIGSYVGRTTGFFVKGNLRPNPNGRRLRSATMLS
jgi:hypothetical protein